jgi:proteasome alpha subunit
MEDMQHQQMGYDRVATMFAPDGHILQVEYAEKTVRLGAASIGMVCKDGIVLISDRRKRDKLVVESSANKIHEVDEHIIAVSAGLISDARVLIDKARVIAQQHRVTYDSAPNTETIVRDIADMKQQFTQYGGARPYGVSMMFAGYNGEKVLYTTDITGTYLQYKANAIGEHDEEIKKILREKYKETMTTKEGIQLALKTLQEVQKEAYNIENIDAGILTEKKITRLSGKELENKKE